MGGQIAFHIGLPKCGSTWLQKRVFPSMEGVNYLGRNYQPFTGHGYAKPSVTKDSVNASLEHISKAHEYVYERPSFENLSASKVNLFSSEMLSEVFNYRRAAFRVKEMFPQARIIISVREQKSLIKSIYFNEVFKGNSSTLSSLLNASDINRQRIIGRPEIWLPHYLYYEMYHFYRSLFGENVLLLPIEAAKEGLFQSMLEEFLTPGSVGVTKGAENLPTKQPIERSARDNIRKVEPNALGLWRRYNALTRRTNKGRREAVLLNAFGKFLPFLNEGGIERQIQDLGAYFAGSNRALSDDIGLDLQKFGYEVLGGNPEP